LKQQLDLLQRLSIEKKPVPYVSHKREVIETENELQNLRMKIGRIEAQKFNKSAVHQHISIHHVDNRYKPQYDRNTIMNASVDMNNSLNGSQGQINYVPRNTYV